MAYAVYYRSNKRYPFARLGELTTATRGRFKGTTISKPKRFERLESAEEEAAKLKALGYDTKIKEVK